MKNALNFIFLFLAVFPLTMYAQQEEFPAGTVPNEHNINGAEYPRIGEDRRVQYKFLLPTQKK